MTNISPFSPHQYLEAGDGEALKTYVYVGEDRSYIYRFLFRPMNQRLIKLCPRWVAPNLITVTGLVLVIISHALMAYFLPDMEDLTDSTPRWAYALSGITLFMYQTLDNLDGLQARLTKTSSPLGLIFDHGCDALNCTVGALTLASTIQAGPTWKTWMMMLNLIGVFFLNTWEEFYRGSLVLPVVNGANEGIVLAVVLHFMTAYHGPAFWRQTVSVNMPMPVAEAFDHVLGHMPRWSSAVAELTTTGTVEIQYNTVIVFLMSIATFFTLVGNVINVYQAIHHGDGHGLYTKRYMIVKWPFLHSLTRLLPILVICVMANFWLAMSPAHIFLLHPRMCSWTIGLLFSKLVTHLMLAHLCSREYHPFRRTLVPIMYLGFHTAFQYFNTRTAVHIDEELVLYEFFTLSALTYTHMCVCVVWEMSTILNLGIFRILTKKE